MSTLRPNRFRFAVAFAIAFCAHSSAQETDELTKPLECLVTFGSQPITDAEVHVVYTVPVGDPDDKDRNRDSVKSQPPPERHVIEETTYRTDENGKYALIPPDLDLPGLAASIAVRHPDYLPRAFDNLTLESLIRYPRSTARRMRLKKAYRLEGRALLPNGKPAVGATVTAASKYRPYSWKFYDPNEYYARNSVKTDSEGRFVVKFDRRSTLQFDLAGYATLLVDQYEAENPDNNTTFRLPNASTVRGRVLDQRGEPVPFAIVSAFRKHVHNESNMPLRYSVSAVTDALGQYEFKLPQDDFVLRVAERLRDDESAKKWLAERRKFLAPVDGVSFESRKRVESIPVGWVYPETAINTETLKAVVDLKPVIARE